MGKGKPRHSKGGQNQDVSRSLSWVLRHGAQQEGLSIDSRGYVPLPEILEYLKIKGFKNVDQAKIEHVVQSNDKKRFQLEEQKKKIFIRATQGHTMKCVKTDDLLEKITDAEKYPMVIHGTYSKFWPLIKKQGLKRMTRNHIHFAPGMPKEEGVTSGMRTSCNVIIELDMFAAMKEGIDFYLSSNNVILTEGDEGVIHPKFFKKVMNKNGGIYEPKQTQKIQQKLEKEEIKKQQKQSQKKEDNNQKKEENNQEKAEM